jgi:hypothetical protein
MPIQTHAVDTNTPSFCEESRRETPTNKLEETRLIASYKDGVMVVEDYGDYIRLIGGGYPVLIYSLFTTPKINLDCCYKPLEPFLGKYNALYYKQDEILEELLTCFVGW